MEINVKEIMSRLDLQHIRSFAFQELPDPMDIHTETYDERLKESNQRMLNRLKNICRDAQELEDATNVFHQSMSASSEVYAEIGIKVGARLLFQLLYQNDV